MPGPENSHDADYERVELVWPGKNRPIEHVSLPFQTIERVNDVRRSRDAQAQLVGAAVGEVAQPIYEVGSHSGDEVTVLDAETGRMDLPSWWTPGWRNRLIWGDNKLVLPSLLEQFAGKIDLIYIDPPFATGADFSYKTQVGDEDIEKQPSMLEEVAYRDAWEHGIQSYLSMIMDRLRLLCSLLTKTGSIYVHCDWRVSGFIRLMMDEVFGKNRFANEIIVCYSGPTNQKNNYPRKHDTIFYYRKADQFTFNADEIRVGYKKSNRSTGKTALTGRANEEYLSELDERGKVIEDYWTDIRTGSHIPKAIRQDANDFPTLKDPRLLERIIKASSNEGDLILDCFIGSGTTVAVAEKLGRRWIGVDIGRFAIQTTRKRLLDLPDCRPFAVQNLGQYERSHWQRSESSMGDKVTEYIVFILDLYKAQPIPGQFQYLHGIREGVAVHVGATDAPVSAEELRAVVAECVDNGFAAVDILGWEWEMGLNPALRDELRQSSGIGVRLLNIPREILDQRNIDAGAVNFFELSVADARIASPYEMALQVELADFIPAVDDYMQQRLTSVPTEWSDWIDYWSVDFEYDGQIFVNQWQSYRTRRDRALNLRSDPHEYTDPGTKSILVKVIDIFGNDTTIELDHQAGEVD